MNEENCLSSCSQIPLTCKNHLQRKKRVSVQLLFQWKGSRKGIKASLDKVFKEKYSFFFFFLSVSRRTVNVHHHLLIRSFFHSFASIHLVIFDERIFSFQYFFSYLHQPISYNSIVHERSSVLTTGK